MTTLDDAAVLVTDARGPVGAALVEALTAVSVRRIYIGAGDETHATVTRSLLDVRERGSVSDAARRMTDVTVVIDTTSTASSPPTSVGGGDVAAITERFDTVALGLARVAAAFLPVLAARPRSSFAAVVSVQAWANVTGAFGVAQAARLSLLEALRTEVAHAGIGVLAAMTECEGDPLAAPDGEAPAIIARRLLRAIEADEFEVLLDEQARRVKRRLCGPVRGRYPELG